MTYRTAQTITAQNAAGSNVIAGRTISAVEQAEAREVLAHAQRAYARFAPELGL